MSVSIQEKRKLIAARLTGPGPGHYGLPSTVGFDAHDASKMREPSYSFGRRLNNGSCKPTTICSPGPAYAISSRITRTGTDGTPSYSMLSRQKSMNKFNTPSPGAYFPEKTHPQNERYAPKYSIGFRTVKRKKDENPSPNKYMLPPLLGSSQQNKTSAPSYSMTARRNQGSFTEDLAKAPGPGRYNKLPLDSYKDKSPHYSLGSCNYPAGDRSVKPAPGDYYPENVKINRPSAPKFSLGTRHSEFVCPVISTME